MRLIDSRGFGLVALLIVVAIIALVSGGAWYKSKRSLELKTIREVGQEKIKETEELKGRIESQNLRLLDDLNSMNSTNNQSLRSVQEKASGVKNQLENR